MRCRASCARLGEEDAHGVLPAVAPGVGGDGCAGGAELFVSGLNLNPTPEKLHLKAWRYLFLGVQSDGTLNPHDYFIWYRNSLFIVFVQGGLNTLWSPYGNNYDLMITGSCFAIVPLLVLYLFAQRFIIEGMTAGAVKG